MKYLFKPNEDLLLKVKSAIKLHLNVENEDVCEICPYDNETFCIKTLLSDVNTLLSEEKNNEESI